MTKKKSLSLTFYKYFSPEEVLQKYKEEFAGSIQNKEHVKALEYKEKVESLRDSASNSLSLISSHFLTFQHNQYYVEKLVFNFLKLNENWIVFTNEVKVFNEFCMSNLYSLEQFEEINHLTFKTSRVLIWISNLTCFDKKLFEKIKNLKEKEFASFYTYLSISKILYDAIQFRELLKEFSFISFDPSFLFQEYGLNFLWFNKDFSIPSIFMGSNASKLSLRKNSISIKELPYSLEIGTSNLISLIILERFFNFIEQEGVNIFSNISCKNLNFNLSSSFKT